MENLFQLAEQLEEAQPQIVMPINEPGGIPPEQMQMIRAQFCKRVFINMTFYLSIILGLMITLCAVHNATDMMINLVIAALATFVCCFLVVNVARHTSLDLTSHEIEPSVTFNVACSIFKIVTIITVAIITVITRQPFLMFGTVASGFTTFAFLMAIAVHSQMLFGGRSIEFHDLVYLVHSVVMSLWVTISFASILAMVICARMLTFANK